MRLPLLALAAGILVSGGCARSAPARPAGEARTARVHAALMRDADALRHAASALETALRRLDTRPATVDSARAAFARARTAYKRVEAFAELYAPATAESLNGPALPEVAEDDPTHTEVPAEGFQVIEEGLFGDDPAAERAALVEEARVLRSGAERLRSLLATRAMTDTHVFDALRQQVGRVVTLGLSGFDSPVALASLPEAATALEAVGAALRPYEGEIRAADPALWARLERGTIAAVAALRSGGGFDDFDRLAFLTDHANPLARDLWAARAALGVATPTGARPWSNTAATLFEPGAVDPHGFAPGYVARPTREQVALGRTLFFDPVLSGDGARSCASCHQPERGFADGRARSLPIAGAAGAVLRNAPTVVNAGLQAGTFADLRTRFLEDQVTAVVENADEMHGALDRSALVLGRSPEYAAAFAGAFGSAGVSQERVRLAVASYVRSLNGLNSRFDRAVRGERDALTAEERRGFTLFMGRARCGTCHFAPLFNGTVPPAFVEAETEVLGVPERAATRGATVSADVGRAGVTRIPLHRHAFKTPTVRNAALTAPYMHNGVFATLEEVVDFYDRGGGAGIGAALEHQTLPPDPLELSAAERRALVAFMHALTDTTGLTARPARLPRLGDATLDARPVGGRY